MGTEAEALNADLKRRTAAKQQVLEKRFQPERTLDAALDFNEFAASQSLPSRADRGIVAETAEKESNFIEGEVHFARETNEQDAVESVR